MYAKGATMFQALERTPLHLLRRINVAAKGIDRCQPQYVELARKTFEKQFSSKDSMVEEMIKYARSCQSTSAAIDTLEHGGHLVQSKPEEVVRVSLVAGELSSIDCKHPQIEKFCFQALDVMADAHEEINTKFQIEASLFARHLLTKSYLTFGKDEAANELTCGYADLDLSLLVSSKNRKVFTAVLEGMKGYSDHSLSSVELAEESWQKVETALGTNIDDWPMDHRINHVMKDYNMFCEVRSPGNPLAYEKVASRAENVIPTLMDGTGVWDSPYLQKQLALDANFAAAQVLAKQGSLDEAEKKLESILHELGKLVKDNDPKIALVILKLGDIYANSHRLTLAEGLYQNAMKQLCESFSSFNDDVYTQAKCHESLIILLDYSYAKLLQKLPRRESEADRVMKRAEEKWVKLSASSKPVSFLSEHGIVDLRTQRVFYCV